MKGTLGAIKEQQLRIAYNSKDSNDLNQHMKDIEVIGNLTIVRMRLKEIL